MGMWLFVRSLKEWISREIAIATRYREDTVVRSHFISGKMTKPYVGLSSLYKTFSASDIPDKILYTLEIVSSQTFAHKGI